MPPLFSKFEVPTTLNVCTSFVQKCASGSDVCAQKQPDLSWKPNGGAIEKAINFIDIWNLCSERIDRQYFKLRVPTKIN